MNIFLKNKTYCFQEIVDICDKNRLTTVDCLKDENTVSIEEYDKKTKELGGECLFEFDRIKDNQLMLRWSKFASKTCKQSSRFQSDRQAMG